MTKGRKGVERLAAALVGLSVGLIGCPSHPLKVEMWLGGKTFGPQTLVACKGSYGPDWINIDFPARGGCLTEPPVDVSYALLAGAGGKNVGGSKLLLQRTVLSRDEDTQIQFAFARRVNVEGGPPIDVVEAGYSLEVTIGGDCQQGGKTKGTGTCRLIPQ